MVEHHFTRRCWNQCHLPSIIIGNHIFALEDRSGGVFNIYSFESSIEVAIGEQGGCQQSPCVNGHTEPGGDDTHPNGGQIVVDVLQVGLVGRTGNGKKKLYTKAESDGNMPRTYVYQEVKVIIT